MNKVCMPPKPKRDILCAKVSELTFGQVTRTCPKHNKAHHTAFLGRVRGCSPDEQYLYLIFYNMIAQADKTTHTYTEDVAFEIDRWVDVEITVKEIS